MKGTLNGVLYFCLSLLAHLMNDLDLIYTYPFLAITL